MNDKEVSANLALKNFLNAVKDAAAESPTFRARLIDALGFTVLYEGDEQFAGANPTKQAGRWSEDAFTRIWKGATVAELRATLSEYDLATKEDIKGLRKNELIALLYRRAKNQAEETGAY